MNEHHKLGIAIDHVNEEKDHFYSSPPEAVEALLRHEEFDGAIWEPACGQGHISEVLKANGYEVISSDLVDRGYGEPRIDFLMEWQSRADNVVTNPPNKLFLPFVLQSLKLTTGKVCMLIPLRYLEGEERKKIIYDMYSPKTIYVFSERIQTKRNGNDIGKGGGGMIAYMWIVWEHGYTGPTITKWI